MRLLLPVLLLVAPLGACASGQGAAVNAVVQDEGQRQKAAAAAQSGETSSEALAHANDAPKAGDAPPR